MTRRCLVMTIKGRRERARIKGHTTSRLQQVGVSIGGYHVSSHAQDKTIEANHNNKMYSTIQDAKPVCTHTHPQYKMYSTIQDAKPVCTHTHPQYKMYSTIQDAKPHQPTPKPHPRSAQVRCCTRQSTGKVETSRMVQEARVTRGRVK